MYAVFVSTDKEDFRRITDHIIIIKLTAVTG